MRSIMPTTVGLAALLAALAIPQVASAQVFGKAAGPSVLTGTFYPDGDYTKAITMTMVGPGMVRVRGERWEGEGLTDGVSYWGVFRLRESRGRPESNGTHRGIVQRDGSIAIHGEYVEGRVGSFDMMWKRAPDELGEPVPSVVLALGHSIIPDTWFGEPVINLPPVHSERARKLGIRGTVLVDALVGPDGRALRTRILVSVPELDAAATDAVRRWVFNPGHDTAWVIARVRFQ